MRSRLQGHFPHHRWLKSAKMSSTSRFFVSLDAQSQQTVYRRKAKHPSSPFQQMPFALQFWMIATWFCSSPGFACSRFSVLTTGAFCTSAWDTGWQFPTDISEASRKHLMVSWGHQHANAAGCRRMPHIMSPPQTCCQSAAMLGVNARGAPNDCCRT